MSLFVSSGARFNEDRSIRWTLFRTWNAALPVVCYIGHNPSDAGEEREDPTSRLFMHYATINGYGGYVTVNQYPWITPDPAKCRAIAERALGGPDWGARDELMQNLSLVAQVAKSAGIVVACWGAIAQDDGWTEHLIEEVQDGEEPWPALYCLGRTQSGAPKHPLARGKHRISREQKFMVWRKNENAAQAA